MEEFKTYHPIVNFVYFLFVIGFSMFLGHPVCLGISFLCGFTYSVMLRGRGVIRTNLLYMLPIVILTALLNPLFNHRGVTVLGYLPGGNPLTLESVVYGLTAAVMLVSVICWFSCYNSVMTSDKFIYLFGRVIPALSLIISMTLRFVPLFAAQLKVVTNAQRCLGRDVSKGNIIKRVKCGMSILSVMLSWSLENAIETADSMKARGYGIPGRTSFSVFRFGKRDAAVLLLIGIFGIYTLVGVLMGGMDFVYFPSLGGAEPSLFGISLFASYFALCICPVMIEIREVGKWNASKLKI